MKTKAKRPAGRPRVENPKQLISIRIDPDVIAKFSAEGKGWRGTMGKVLAAWARNRPEGKPMSP